MTDLPNETSLDARWQFWIDRGGTFTDIVALSPEREIETRKLLSVNPEAYDDAALHGIRQFLELDAQAPIPGDRIAAIKMGTTVATNALLERQGVPTLFVTTSGFRDVTEIGYQARPDTFALNIRKPELLQSKVIEVAERVLADGLIEVPLDAESARQQLRQAYVEGYRSVAIALMHAYQFTDHERELAKIAREIGFEQVSTSHEVSPLMKIVSRAETTIVDAYLTPILAHYVGTVRSAFADGNMPGQLLFMQSSGGLTAAEQFRGRDAILSGPAGGIVGCVETAQAAGFSKVVGFDMGGTSTDVSHFAGEFETVYETEVAGVRMRVPMLHIHTVAAGGGSVLRYHEGRFRVGPESAGADPGPACYRRGGPLAVTDINLCLGKLQPNLFPKIFGPNQDQPIDLEAARTGFARIADEIDDGRSAEDVAEGFLNVAVEYMAEAIKKISLARGYDVQDYVLNCFGGAGGQHACLVAERLGISKILLHHFAGVLSAYGIGLAPIRSERQAVIDRELEPKLEAEIAQRVEQLGGEAEADLHLQGVPAGQTRRSAKALLKYAGTDTTISVEVDDCASMLEHFERAHQRQYGFTAKEKRVKIETLIVECASVIEAEVQPSVPEAQSDGAMIGTTQFYSNGAWHEADVVALERLGRGSKINGPAIVIEGNGTIVIEPGWVGTLDGMGNLILELAAKAKSVETALDAVDPVTLELFNNRYMSIAEQMGIVLRNTSQSVNVKERLDFSCAIFDAAGSLVANAPHVPVHLGSMDASVQTIIASGQTINPGDAFVHNNPHNGGSHLPDITVVSPVFDEDQRDILFYVASRAHHEDVGGVSPGSMSPFATTITEEGVILDNEKLVERGVFMTERIERLLTTGPYPARSADQNIADLMAQVAANSAGAGGLLKLVREYGRKTVHAYMQHIQDNAEAAVRSAIATLDDGAAEITLDSGAQIKVSIRIDKQARSAVVDFSGTSAQLETAFNAPAAVARAAVLYVIRCLVADDIPLNAGCMKPIDLLLPEGSMLNPKPPAAVVAGNVETSQAVTDIVFAALGRLGSGQGTMNNLTFGNERYQYYETICSGAPAGPGFDGAAAVHTHMTNTRMTDPEILERRFPVILDSFEIDRNSGGRGQWNAGDGITRTIRFREAMECSILSDHRVTAPLGVAGGEPGRIGRNWITRVNGSVAELGGCGKADVAPGDRVTIRTPTGGGFGPAHLRDAKE